MKQYLQGALVANAASMGYNWVYNMPYLERLSATTDLVFEPVDPEKYKRAGKSYLAYPFAQVGDVSQQGDIAKWLYQGLKDNSELDRKGYEQLIFDKIQPGGAYVGYVEAYGKKLIINTYQANMKLPFEPLEQNDDQLVGFIPYLVCKELGLSNDKAFELASLFTHINDYRVFYDMFDAIIEHAPQKGLRQAIEQSIQLAPTSYHEVLQKAIEFTDTKAFILNHSGTACHIPHAIPLIIHILYHSDSYESAVKLNTKIGGASCDRGMLIGAVMSQVFEVPKAWIDQTHLT